MEVLYQLSYSPEDHPSYQCTSVMQLSLLFCARRSLRLRIMSIPVDPTKLGEELEKFGHSAFLLTVRDDDTSHVAHMTFRLQQGDLYCPISKTAARNVQVRPNVVVPMASP